MTVRNWEFFHPPTMPSAAVGLGGEIDPLRLLKRRGSLVVADMPVSPVAAAVGHGMAQLHHHHPQQGLEQPSQAQPQTVPAEMKSGGHLPKQPAAPVFEEPDANSLLDSFGF